MTVLRIAVVALVASAAACTAATSAGAAVPGPQPPGASAGGAATGSVPPSGRPPGGAAARGRGPSIPPRRVGCSRGRAGRRCRGTATHRWYRITLAATETVTEDAASGTSRRLHAAFTGVSSAVTVTRGPDLVDPRTRRTLPGTASYSFRANLQGRLVRHTEVTVLPLRGCALATARYVQTAPPMLSFAASGSVGGNAGRADLGGFVAGPDLGAGTLTYSGRVCDDGRIEDPYERSAQTGEAWWGLACEERQRASGRVVWGGPFTIALTCRDERDTTSQGGGRQRRESTTKLHFTPCRDRGLGSPRGCRS